MGASPGGTLADPQEIIVDLRRKLVEAQQRLDERTAERDEALEQQTATAEVLGIINSSPGDLTPVFDAMLEKAMRLCGAAFGMMGIKDGDRSRTVATRGVPAVLAEFRRHNPAPPTAPIWSRVLQGEPFIHTVDLKQEKAYESGDPQRRALVDLGGARTSLAVTLMKDPAILGAIHIYRQEVRPFTDKQIALLQDFAAQAVIAMENARLITETREALEQQTATAEVLQVINSSPGNLAPVFEAILEKAHRLCGASYGSLQIYDGERFRALAVRGLPEQFANRLREGFVVDENHPTRALLRGEACVHIHDMAELEVSGARTTVEIGGMRTLLSVALRKGDRLLGQIVAARPEVRPFAEREIALIESFAAQAVIAMENARLINETREALEQQTATAEVLGVINSSPGDLAPVFNAMLEKATSLCEAAAGIFWVADGEHFRPAVIRGMPEAFVEVARSYRPGPGAPVARLSHGERQVHLRDLAAEEVYKSGDPLVRAGVDHGGIRTLLSVPLRREDELLGMFSVYRREVRPFDDKQIALIGNFAAQAVIAMENARLLGELRERTEEVGELNRGLEARVAEQVEELSRVGRLKRFLAPQLAEMIVSLGNEKILESHRREIVVVFCDLRGYTAFTETAEPEEVLDFLREYHGALGPMVSQFEGTLDQFSGDGIMVFFNDPLPCPDPAERAVKMAMAMRESASTLIASWRERGRELGFGVGIAQGYATLGQIGFSERSGYTAIGTVCNVAARLCAEAKDGQILLSQRVNVALKVSVATEQVGALALKGLAQPVVAYNVPLAATQPALRVIEGGGPQNA